MVAVSTRTGATQKHKEKQQAITNFGRHRFGCRLSFFFAAAGYTYPDTLQPTPTLRRPTVPTHCPSLRLASFQKLIPKAFFFFNPRRKPSTTCPPPAGRRHRSPTDIHWTLGQSTRHTADPPPIPPPSPQNQTAPPPPPHQHTTHLLDEVVIGVDADLRGNLHGPLRHLLRVQPLHVQQRLGRR